MKILLSRFNNSPAVALATIIIGLIGTIFGIIGFLYVKRPNLTIRETGNVSVLKELESVSEIGIKYKGVDIPPNRFDLRLITLKVMNDGDMDIKKSDYDEALLPGVEISNGKLLSVPDIIPEETSTDYLRANAVPYVDSTHIRIFLPMVILGVDESYTFKMLVISDKDSPPSVEAFGKVAGVKQINFSEPSLPSYTLRRRMNALGNMEQTLLVAGITSIVMVSLFILLFPIVGWVEYSRSRRWKRTHRKSFNEFLQVQLPKMTGEKREKIAQCPKDLGRFLWDEYEGDAYNDPLFETKESGLVLSFVVLAYIASVAYFFSFIV